MHNADTSIRDAAGAHLRELRVIPVAVIHRLDQVEPTVTALRDGGLPCIEITFRTDVAAEAIRRASAIDGVLVGAGTLHDPAEAAAAAAAGAGFAVAPGLNEDVVAACQEAGLPFFPGIATPTELERALALGCQTVKVFPAEQLGGPAFIRSLAAVYRDVEFIPTGGINARSAPSYLELDRVLAVAGSWVVASSLLDRGCFDDVRSLAGEAAAMGTAPS